MSRPLVALSAFLCAAALLFAPSAGAADSVWWTNYEAGLISTAPLAGGSGTDLAPAPAVPEGPYGSVVDAAAGKLYWANFGGNTIAVSNLDGSGSTTLNTAGATVSDPTSLAIDPAAGKVFWMNANANKISWAALDGSGGGDLATAGAPISLPEGVAVYPATGRIYWANSGVDSIAYANLDGSGGGEVSIPAGDLDGPDAVAIDAASGVLYWTNNAGHSIGFAHLDGLGAGLLSTAGVTVSNPTGMAVDAEAGRLYWADEGGGGIFSVALTGGDARRLDTGAANSAKPSYPFLFKAPKTTYYAVPAVLAIAKPGATLTCSGANEWKPDLPESFLFRAPQSIGYSWTLGGAPVAGATGPTLVATAEGTYNCQIIATNGAGSTTGYGGTWEVRTREERPHRPLLEVLKLKRSQKTGTATVVLAVSGPGTATLSGKQVVRRSVKSSRAGVVKVRVAARGKALRKLKKTGKVKVAIKLGFRSTEGAEAFIARAISLSRKLRR